MKRFNKYGMIVLAFMMLLPMESGYSQTPAKKPLPQVPISYPGDTNETIIRRAQWMEGAKKEGSLVWWGTATPTEGGNIIAAFNKVYPFITGSYWRGKGEEIASKLELEHSAARGSVDQPIFLSDCSR